MVHKHSLYVYCDDCGESIRSVDLTNERHILNVHYPRSEFDYGWTSYHGKLYCPICSEKFVDALNWLWGKDVLAGDTVKK